MARGGWFRRSESSQQCRKQVSPRVQALVLQELRKSQLVTPRVERRVAWVVGRRKRERTALAQLNRLGLSQRSRLWTSSPAVHFPWGRRWSIRTTPNDGDKTVLQYDDVVKFDFDTHINVCIISVESHLPVFAFQIFTVWS
jgi:hypothetical protein